MRERVGTIGLAAAMLLAAGCGVRRSSQPMLLCEPQDNAICLLMQELQEAQPGPPYGLPAGATYNYIWAQYAMAFLALDRCGYMEREEALARIRAIVDKAGTFERYHGFFFDSYNPQTGKRTSDNVYFQGWWLYALYVLRIAYPELTDTCDRLLADVDYEGSGLFDAATRQLAADYNVASRRVSYWIDLFAAPAGEMRTPYIVYTLLTGDISPWTQPDKQPSIAPIEGFPVLSVWHNFHFCTMFVHVEFPEVGYFERSWNELLAGLNAYRARHQMLFYPTRAEPLESWTPSPQDEWPNDEHGIAKPWLAWLGDPSAPVMEKAYSPGYGISLYYDRMRFSWSFGGALRRCEQSLEISDGSASSRFRFPFTVFPLPENIPLTTPLRLKVVRFYASRTETAPPAPIEVVLDGHLIARVEADEIGSAATLVERTWDDLRIAGRHHTIELRCAPDALVPSAVALHRYATNYWKCTYLREHDSAEREQVVDAPFLEITIDGQREGSENPYAVLARCAAIHSYYVWHELLRDETFAERLVAWVGDYYNRVRLARVVHNVSDRAVVVSYEDAERYFGRAPTAVVDITGDATSAKTAPFERQTDGTLTWIAEPRHTYRVLLPDQSSHTR